MPRPITTAVLAAALVAVAVVCAQATLVEDATYAGPKTTITMAIWQVDHEPVFAKVAEAFVAEHPEVAVEIKALGWDNYWTYLTNSAAARDAPDVFEISTDAGRHASWFAKGACLDVTDLIERDGVDLDEHIAVARDAVTYKGRRYGLPYGVCVRVLMYNKDLFDAAGLPHPDETEPMTWADFRELGRRLTKHDARGDVVQYGISWSWSSFACCIQGAGGRLVDDYVQPTRFTADTPEVADGIRFYMELMTADKVAPLMTQQAALGFDQPDFALLSGRVAMMVSGYHALPRLAEKQGLRFGLAPLPVGKERSQEALTNLFCVSAYSRKQDAAWAFLKFLTSESGQTILIRNGSSDVPTCRAVLDSAAFRDDPWGVGQMDVFTRDLEYALGPPAIPTDKFPRKLDRVKNKLYQEKITPRQAAAMIQRDGDRILVSLGERPIPPTTRVVVPAVLVVVLAAGVGLAIVLSRRGEAVARRAIRAQDNRWGYVMTLPWILGFALFVFGPMLAALLLSFTDWGLFNTPRWVGADNYAQIVTRDPDFATSFAVTVAYVAAALLVQVVGALAAAVLLDRRLYARGVFRTIFYLPVLLSGVAMSFLWAWMYNAEYGLINSVLGLVGIRGPNWLFSDFWAWAALVLMNCVYVGGNMLIYLAALQGVPQHLYDAAAIDGAGPWRTFRHVTLPQITPAILFTLVIGTIYGFQVFTEPFVMTSGVPDTTNFLVVYLYNVAFGDQEMGYACALAVILFVVIFVFAYAQIRTSRRWVYYEMGGQQ